MMMPKLACFFITAAAAIGLAAAQSSQTHYSSAKPHPHRVQSVSKPLTAKSAMPAKHKSSVGVPNVSKTNRSTNEELTRLEREPVKAGNGKSTPAAGAKVSTPGANSRTSATRRVAK